MKHDTLNSLLYHPDTGAGGKEIPGMTPATDGTKRKAETTAEGGPDAKKRRNPQVINCVEFYKSKRVCIVNLEIPRIIKFFELKTSDLL